MSAIRCNDGSLIACDNGRHDIMDESGKVIQSQEDTELAGIVADAVIQALATRRKAKDALPDPKDHRRDLDSNARRGMTERQHHNSFDAAMDSGVFIDLDAMFNAPVQHRGFEDNTVRVAHDSATASSALLDLDALFDAPVRGRA
jgi:hypothetical protein